MTIALLTFTPFFQLDLDRADALYNHAAKLMTDYADSPVVLDSVRPKSIELQRMSQTLRELFIQRLESLERSRDLYHRIEKANRWCSQGVDLLASQQLEKCSSPEFAAQALADIEDFFTSASEFRDPKQFRNMFQDIITPETKSLINQVKIYCTLSLVILYVTSSIFFYLNRVNR